MQSKRSDVLPSAMLCHYSKFKVGSTAEAYSQPCKILKRNERGQK